MSLGVVQKKKNVNDFIQLQDWLYSLDLNVLDYAVWGLYQ